MRTYKYKAEIAFLAVHGEILHLDKQDKNSSVKFDDWLCERLGKHPWVVKPENYLPIIQAVENTHRVTEIDRDLHQDLMADLQEGGAGRMFSNYIKYCMRRDIHRYIEEKRNDP